MKKDYFENNALLLDSDAKIGHFKAISKKYPKFFLKYLRQQLSKATNTIFRPKTCRNKKLLCIFANGTTPFYDLGVYIQNSCDLFVG